MNVIFKMVEDSNDTYIFFNIDDKKIIAENKIAKSYFTFTNKDINTIFVNENSIIEESIERLKNENLAYFWDVEIRYSNDKHEKADIQIGYADNDLKSLFISIKTNSFDKFLQMRKFVDLSNKPIFVLTQNNDDYKVYYANDHFYSTIGMDIDKFKDSYNCSFTNLLVEDKRQDYINELNEALINDVEYATDIEIENEKGDRFWFFFDLYKISNAYRRQYVVRNTYSTFQTYRCFK